MRQTLAIFLLSLALAASAAAQSPSPAVQPNEEAFLVAFEQGKREFSSGLYAEAVASFAIAGANVSAVSGDVDLARAELLTHEGAALMYQAMQVRAEASVEPEDVLAHAKFHEAISLMAPALNEATPGGEISPRIRAYAAARAWHSLLDARLGNVLRPWRHEFRDAPAVRSLPGACPVRIIPQPVPRYPSSASSGRLNVGAVAVRFHFNAEGDLIMREVAASAPNRGEFVQAVDAVINRWRAEWERSQPPGCTRAQVITTTITFRGARR